MGSDANLLLAIDAGNTRIKWGVNDGRAWIRLGAVETRAASALSAEWRGMPIAEGAIASNVAGPEVEAQIRQACGEFGLGLAIARSCGSQLGVVNGYRDPRQLGSDRWAALVAAHRAHAGHTLVVNVGTALTIDALDAGGQFRGGLIVPGPALMRRSLDRGTASLRLTDGRVETFPASTPDAITSGAVQACVGAIERMQRAMAADGAAPDNVLLSGGAAGEIAPHLPMEFVLNENLVLDGLVLIARNA